MKQFLKFTFATILGIILTSLMGFLILIMLISAVTSSADKSTQLVNNSVYQIDLDGVLVDRSEDNPLDGLISEAMGKQDTENTIGLDDLLSNIEKAKNNPNIVGIYLRGGNLQAGMASVTEIRNALLDFKKAGKFIVSYADNYTQKMYYLASVSNKVLLNPQGMIELKGLSSETMFIKNTLDKLGVEMQIVKVGTFKSAVEPLINTQMSDANREQVTVYLTSIWKNMVQQISDSRKISTTNLNLYADEMMMFQPAEKTIETHLADSLVYIDQVENIVKSQIKKLNNDDKMKIVKHSDMKNLDDTKNDTSKNIAIIYAVGEISDDAGDGIVAKKLIETIHKVEKDSTVLATVLRISSPGGSAYASEQIWRALSLLKKSKPLVVSMGDYAASGGYYIACMADKIVAQPTTITGSIGIFGVIPNIKGLNDKIGLSFDGVKTNKMSDAISINRPFTPEEKNIMQNYVNRGYELFVKRCADGRKKSVENIKSIAEGRVWTGEDALKIGLVDKIGGLNDAIKQAAELAKLKSYSTKDYPEKENFEQKLLKSMSDDVETRFLKYQFGEQYSLIKQVRKIKEIKGLQARLPFDFNLQ